MVKQLLILATAVTVLFALCGSARADANADKAKAVVALVKAKAAAPCSCGDACRCAAGACPSGCPVAKPAPRVTYREVWYTDGRRTWKELVPEPGAGPCPNGRCPAPR